MINGGLMLASAVYWVRQSRRATIGTWIAVIVMTLAASIWALSTLVVPGAAITLSTVVMAVALGMLAAAFPSAFVLIGVATYVNDKQRAQRALR